MTIYDKGLLRAMKAAYKETGYIVAVTEDQPLVNHLAEMQWIPVELE